MTTPFPGTRDHTIEDARYGILGAPLDVSTTFVPGTRFGPAGIRQQAMGFEDFDHRTGAHFSELRVVDRGDLHPWADVAEYLDFLTGEVAALCEQSVTPILLGGEHTISIAGIRATAPDLVMSIDAHLDLREEFDGDPWSHATVMHHALGLADRGIILGARAGCEAEWGRAEQQTAIKAIEPDGIADWLGTTDFGDASIYLTIDIDAIDPAFAPGTGTREPFGLTPSCVRDIIDAVAPNTIGFDVVETNDRDEGQTACVAAKLVRECIFQHAQYHQ